MNHTAIYSLLYALIVAAWANPSWAAQEELRIRVENRPGGAITVSRDAGRNWLQIGQVTSPANAVNRHSYNASRWVPDSTVTATAVNAIHIKVANAAETGYGITFSLVPAGEVIGAATRKYSSVIATDMPPGSGLFGGLGPHVGSPVYIEGTGRKLSKLAGDYHPTVGAVLMIVRQRPPQRLTHIEFADEFGEDPTVTWTDVRYIDFANEFGGDITVTCTDGSRQVIGLVMRPVCGIGRFEGTRYAAAGRLRANHAGVIDISTSPYGMVGGFQIIPASHANDAEVSYIKTNTQWMVVGPSHQDESWKGAAPLFSGYLYPSYRPDDLTGGYANWLQRTLSRCQVLAKIGSGDWGLLPRIALDPQAPETSRRPEGNRTWHIRTSLDVREPLPAAAQRALMNLRAVRIRLPQELYWPE